MRRPRTSATGALLAPEINSASWVIAWACLAAFVLLRHARRGPNVGLLLTWIFIFGTLHWFAPALHLLPWFNELPGDLTAEGLRESTLGLAGFVIGVELLTIGRRRQSDTDDPEDELELATTTRLVNLYLTAGVVLYLFTLLGGRLPFLAAVVSTGSTLVAVSVGLKCWLDRREGRIGHSWLWLGLAGLFPLLTLLAQGFLGYGFVAVLIVASFVASQQPTRWKTALIGVFLIYLGLSIYVTYMRDRSDIRDVVWGGQGMDARFAQVANTFRSAEWFNPWDIDHLNRVDRRLNQDHLIGSAVAYLREGSERYAGGSTLVDAVIALVPRALWPGKPVVGGSGDIVTNYTGIRFAFGTSVGVGQVMELHINFGTPGVVLGFVTLGMLVALVDRRAARHLSRGDIRAFALWYMPGLSLLQIGGSLAEVTATAAASAVLILAVSSFVRAPAVVEADDEDHAPRDTQEDDRSFTRRPEAVS
jgi:hypothetical protein